MLKHLMKKFKTRYMCTASDIKADGKNHTVMRKQNKWEKLNREFKIIPTKDKNIVTRRRIKGNLSCYI